MNLQIVEKQFSDYFMNIDVREEEKTAESDARELWDEDHPLNEVLDLETACDILDVLLFSPEKAKARLEKVLDDAYDAYVRRAKEDAAEAQYDAYISAMEECF